VSISTILVLPSGSILTSLDGECIVGAVEAIPAEQQEHTDGLKVGCSDDITVDKEILASE